ncbi:MAG TPA: GntR family transcriptional regulator [Clostridiaceae bacterium]|nr:GntR family transcriptional regulator [Clostridiaceae bacterium]
MDIIISNSTRKPIYEQITSQIKQMIMTGELKSGESIPSMRSLAKSLHISVITVQRAYEDLQRDGFIETTIGRGSFVSSNNKDFIQEEKQKEIESHLQKAIELSKENGISLTKLIDLLKIFYEEEK